MPTLQCVPRGGRVAVVPCGPSHLEHATRNLVATVNLDCKLDLKTITLHARNAEYNPKVSAPWFAQRRLVKRPHALVCPAALRGGYHAHPRTQDDGTHLRQWQAGARPLWLAGLCARRVVRVLTPPFSAARQVCTGAKTEQMARLAARKYFQVIQKLGFPAQFKVCAPQQESLGCLQALTLLPHLPRTSLSRTLWPART